MTISALKDTLAHPEYLKHNINTQDQVSLILPGCIVLLVLMHFLLSRQEDTPTPPDAISLGTISLGVILPPVAGQGPFTPVISMAQVRIQCFRTIITLVLELIYLVD